MKKLAGLLLMILIFGACSSQFNEADNQLASITVTPTISIPESINVPVLTQDIYVIDVRKDWGEVEYNKTFGMELYYFNSPISSPYQYSYICEDENMTIEAISETLGEAMMNDFMRDYEGKTFTVTEYHNLEAEVMSEEKCSEWEANYLQNTGKKLVLSENQWLCTFTCQYKYTGVYANIGEMPEDLEWMTALAADGSGEDYVFIIQKNGDSEYILRAMPKAVKELSK